MTLVYFKCEFIRPFVYSEMDSNCFYFTGVAFEVARLQGTDGLRHWLWVGIFMHQVLLKYCFSEGVASFQVAVPFGVMPFVVFWGFFSFSPPPPQKKKKIPPSFQVSLFLKGCIKSRVWMALSQSAKKAFGA